MSLLSVIPQKFDMSNSQCLRLIQVIIGQQASSEKIVFLNITREVPSNNLSIKSTITLTIFRTNKFSINKKTKRLLAQL